MEQSIFSLTCCLCPPAQHRARSRGLVGPCGFPSRLRWAPLLCPTHAGPARPAPETLCLRAAPRATRCQAEPGGTLRDGPVPRAAQLPLLELAVEGIPPAAEQALQRGRTRLFALTSLEESVGAPSLEVFMGAGSGSEQPDLPMAEVWNQTIFTIPSKPNPSTPLRSPSLRQTWQRLVSRFRPTHKPWLWV